MATLPWNQGIVDWFLANRVDWLTSIFVFFTFLGNELGYILLVAIVYWLFNKKLGVQLVIATVATTLLNHTLKLLISNPRPYVSDGTYQDKWAIPESDIEETAHSFSTPSGHAQGSSTFWWYLHLKAKSRLTFVLLPVMVILIGISRPYLGVHYLEDIILGWIIGFIVVIFLHRYDNQVATWWNSNKTTMKFVIALLPSILVSVVAGLLFGFGVDGEQYVTLSAIFSGIALGVILDTLYIDYNPDLSIYPNLGQKIVVSTIRMVIGLVVVGILMFGLSALFDLIAEDLTPLGYVLRYVRYSSIGLGATVIVPIIFQKLKLSK